MYSPRLYKYLDSYVLYRSTVHAFGSVLLSHTLLVQTHIHDVSGPCIIKHTLLICLFVKTAESTPGKVYESLEWNKSALTTVF